MNSKQRRKQRRAQERASFEVIFSENNETSIRDYVNIWTANVKNDFIPPEARERLLKNEESLPLYPMELLNPDGTPMLSNAPVVDATISFDFKGYEQSTEEGLAKTNPSV